MSEEKTITVCEEVYELIKKDKGNSTWNTHLKRMYQMAYGDVGLKAPKIQDFQSGGVGGTVGKARTPPDGELVINFRLSKNGNPLGYVLIDDPAPNEEVTIELGFAR